MCLLATPTVEAQPTATDPGTANACYQAYRDNDYTRAFDSCEAAADAGDASAAFIMASLLALKENGIRDFSASVYWLERAADGGHVEAAYNLGVSYQNGHGTQQSYEQAARWYRLAANDGSAKAQRNLGILYENGQGLERSDKLAFYWYRQAAERGLDEAQLKVGLMYLAGRGVTASQTDGFTWIERAAEADNENAQLSLGLLLDSNGRGEGIPWYERAAERDNKFALHNLAVIYMRGEQTSRDLEKARLYAERSVTLGNTESVALLQDINAAQVEAAVGGFDELSSAAETLAPELALHSGTTPDIVERAPPPPEDLPGDAPASLAPLLPVQDAPPHSGWLRDVAWLQAQPSGYHTIQLAVASNIEAINRYIRKHGIGHHAHFFPSAKGAGDSYLLVYGIYPNRSQARLAARQLPRSLRDEYWVRGFRKLQEQHLP